MLIMMEYLAAQVMSMTVDAEVLRSDPLIELVDNFLDCLNGHAHLQGSEQTETCS